MISESVRLAGWAWAVVALATSLSVVASGRGMNDLPAGETADRTTALFTGLSAPGTAAVLELDLELVRQRAGHGRFVLEAFPVRPDLAVDLEVERFRLAGPNTRFVLGRQGAPDIRLSFDPDQIVLLRGKVLGHPGSHVFLGLANRGSIGTIDLGPGAGKFQVSANGGGGIALEPRQLVVFPTSGGGVVAPDVEPCRLLAGDDGRVPSLVARHPVIENDLPPPPAAPLDGYQFGPRGGGSTLNQQQIELAIETDYELYALFGNTEDTLTYIVQLYAAISDIYLRDVNTRIDLSFVRLWDTPDDLFNQEDPIAEFRQYWNQNMTEVHRDVAQFCSGRVNFPYGGVAYINGLCNDYSYSVTGYNLGYFVNPDVPHVFNRDIIINAHELGHNCGAYHTHDYGLDTCNQEEGPAQRGTIMSYCGQTRSGGDANHDLRFHSFVQGEMEAFIFSVGCVADDCNGNGVEDVDDITAGTSEDLNGNGVPDECEDCNGNGQLDDADIQGGGSLDLNGNGIPDECEPDCNENGVPDDLDISGGFSDDLDANNIPDECQEDCDADGTADYLQIMADMSLDLDRNARFDACQDCDGDGTPDLVELDGAHDVWVATSSIDHVIREFHAVTGAMVRESDAGAVTAANDLIIDQDGRIFVSSADDARIVEFDRTGGYVGDLVPSGGGGLVAPTGLTIQGEYIFVADTLVGAVRQYDIDTGDYIGAFVAPGAGGIGRPFGLAFGPTGNLFVTSLDNRVLEYDGSTGAFVGEFVTASDNGGLTEPRGILFKPDGNLLVASLGTNAVLEFDGLTGAFLRQFNNGGTADRLTLDEPWSIRIGPDGDVYVSRHGTGDPPPSGGGGHLHLTQARIYQFDVSTGRFVRAYLIGNDTGLDFPTGFDFMPGDQADCNFNQIPDPCDIADGTSDDVNGNSIPDECEPPRGDMNCDLVVDLDDVGPFVTALTDPDTYLADYPDCDLNLADVNGDGSRNGLDVRDFVNTLLNP
jgi:outer membrane protein assembly factor BamB